MSKFPPVHLRRPSVRTSAALLAAAGLIGATAAITPHLVAGSARIQGARSVASAVQGGCNPYQVQAVSIGTFNMAVCISDNGTGTTAYPLVRVDLVPVYLGTCTIGIELWDNNGNSYGMPRQADCRTGIYPGNPFGPVTEPLTLHAVARLKICLVTCTSYLGNGEGDSPSIELQPSVVTTPTATPSTATSQQPVPVPPVPPGSGNKQQQADCLNNRPTSGPSSFVQPNGNGWNEYTTVGGNGTRPGTATACLDQSHVAGTMASQTADVVGMQDAYTEVDNWNLNPDPNNRPATQIDATRTVQRCHLIAGSNAMGGLGMTVPGKGPGGSLGGDGSQASNLVPCWQNVNTGRGSAATNMTSMARVEDTVRQQADNVPAGSAIYYQVTPNYRSGNSTVPDSITVVAYRQDPGQPPPGIPVVSTTVIPNARMVPTVIGGNVTLNLGN